MFACSDDFNAIRTAAGIQCAYKQAPSVNLTTGKWFLRFKEGQLELCDAAASGGVVEFAEDRLNAVFHHSPRQTTHELPVEMGCSHVTFFQRLQ